MLTRSLTRPLSRPMTAALDANLSIQWSPAALFQNGEQGAWYDPSDMRTLFQDIAGTVPVTASGQPVGRMLDKSGRGCHATQSDGPSRPTFMIVGGLCYLAFDGVNDHMSAAGANFTATDKVSIIAGVLKSNDATAGSLVELSSSPAINGVFGLLAPNGAAQPGYGFRSRGTADSFLATPMTYAAPITNVVTGLGDISGDGNVIRVNGVQVASQATDQGTGNYSSSTLYVGMRGGASNAFVGNLYGLIVRGAASSAQQLVQAERFLGGKCGVAL